MLAVWGKRCARLYCVPRRTAFNRFSSTVKFTAMKEGQPFVVLRKENVQERMKDGKDVTSWLQDNKDFLEKKLLEYGAILLRGFPIHTASEFDSCVGTFHYKPLHYTGGGSPGRERVHGNAYLSTKFPGNSQIWLHNEQSYQTEFPSKVFFYCLKAPEGRGGTPIANARAVYNTADQSFVKKMRERGIRYSRGFYNRNRPEEQKNCLIPKSWQDAFAVETKEEVDLLCKKVGYSMTEWMPDTSVIVTSVSLPVSRVHPVTGENVWFNQIQGWDPRVALLLNFTGISPSDKCGNFKHMFSLYPQSTCFGDDNSVIPFEDTRYGWQHTWKHAVHFDWQKGDLLMLDNYLTMHGRTTVTGERTILAALAS